VLFRSRCTTSLVELSQVANVQRLLPGEFLDTSKTMITEAFLRYAQPLIGEPLPVYQRLVHTKVK